MVVDTAENDAPAEIKPDSCGKNGVSADDIEGIASARRLLRMCLIICIPCRSMTHAWHQTFRLVSYLNPRALADPLVSK